MLGEVLHWEVRRRFLEGCEDVVGVGDAGVFQTREGIAVTVCPNAVSITSSDPSKGRDAVGEHAPRQLMGIRRRVYLHGFAPVLEHQVLRLQLLDLVAKGVASIAQFHDILLILIDLLLGIFALALEFIGPFYQLSQSFGDGGEVRVMWELGAQVRHICREDGMG